MPGDNIDDLAKSNLEHFQPEFNPEDWKAMDSMLESGKKTGILYRSRKLFIAAAAILLFITGGLLGYFIDKTITPENILQPEQPAFSIEHIEKGALENMNESINKSIQATPETIAGSAKSESLIIESEDESNSDTKGNSDNIKGINNSNTPPPSITVAANNINKRANRSNNLSPFKQSNEKNNEIEQELKVLTFSDMTPESLPNILPYKKLSSGIGLLPEIDYEEKLNGIKTKRKISGSIGFLMSPDINIPNNSSSGYTTGVTGEISLSKKVSLSTGILFSKKKYKDESELKASATLIPEATSADFQLIEVPLLARYNISTNKRLLPFISAGISGYFPIKEEYDIYCKTVVTDSTPGYGNSYVPSTTIQETNSNLVVNSYSNNIRTISGDQLSHVESEVKNINNYHLKPYLGFLNLSAGIEYKLSPAISLQLAPQVKVPLTGMGLEEKMVTTISFNSSIKYHFGN